MSWNWQMCRMAHLAGCGRVLQRGAAQLGKQAAQRAAASGQVCGRGCQPLLGGVQGRRPRPVSARPLRLALLRRRH